jgi:molecular chaperone HtpG
VQCATKENLKINEDEDEKKAFEEAKASTEGLCKLIKEVLDDKVSGTPQCSGPAGRVY